MSQLVGAWLCAALFAGAGLAGAIERHSGYLILIYAVGVAFTLLNAVVAWVGAP